MKLHLIFLSSILFYLTNISSLNAQQKKITHQTGIKAGIGFSGKVFMGEGTYHLNYHLTEKFWLSLETGVTVSYWFRLRNNGKHVPKYSFNLGTQLGYALSENNRLFSRLGYILDTIHGPMFQSGVGYSMKVKKSEFQLLFNREIARDLYRPFQMTPYGEIYYSKKYFSFSITYLKSFRFRF